MWLLLFWIPTSFFLDTPEEFEMVSQLRLRSKPSVCDAKQLRWSRALVEESWTNSRAKTVVKEDLDTGDRIGTGAKKDGCAAECFRCL